jgi:hypothetical protein
MSTPASPQPTPPPADGDASHAKVVYTRNRPKGTASRAAVTGWRRLLPLSISETAGGRRVRIRLLAALVWILVGVMLLWLGGAGAALLHLKYRRGFEAATYPMMLRLPLPGGYKRMQEARGTYLIDSALAAMKAGKWDSVVGNLRQGIARAPAHKEGRLLLAQLFASPQVFNRPELAQQFIIEGLQYHRKDAEYVRSLFGYLMQRQEDAEIERIATGMLKDVAPPLDELERYSALALVTAQFQRGDFDSVEANLERYRLNDSLDSVILRVRMDWERGERELALQRLRALHAQVPQNEEIYASLSTYLRESGLDNELRRLCLLRQISYPDQPRAQLDLLYVLDRAGEKARVDTEADALFTRFADNPAGLTALCDFAANSGRSALARRIYEHCIARQLPWEAPALMLVEAQIVARQYQTSLDTTRELFAQHPEWGKRFYATFNGLQAIAHYGLGDTEAAQLFLNNFLNKGSARAENLIAVANRLKAVGATAQARQALAKASQIDELNQTALINLIRLDIEAGDAESAVVSLRRLLTMRKPPRELLNRSFEQLASDQYLFVPDRASLLTDLRKAMDTARKSGVVRTEKPSS